MRKIIILLISVVCFSIQVSASSIIRDSEIEEVIKEISEPVIKAAKINDVKIYLVQDDSFNAFTTLGNRIYIFSGLINQMPYIDVLRSIIAHELGHIAGGHIARQDEAASQYNKLAMSSVAIGLASILSGAGAIAIAPMAMGMHIADRSMMAYSRSMESSADQAALRYLEQSGNTSKGMIESFEFLKKQHYAAFVNPYDQTHPMSNDRLVAVKNSYSHSKFKENTNSSGLSYRFARASGKLRAFTANNPKELLQNLTSKTDEVAIYMKSILNFRTGNINKAVSCINELLKLKPNDPFYNELKGQILFESGQKEAIDFYAKASSLRPGDNLILLGKAIVGITIYKDSPDKIEPFFQEAKLVSEKEPENIIPLYYMAIYYEKTGQKYLSLLNTAVIALKDGDLHRAKILATEAKKGLPKDSPSWYRAGDIILQSEK